MMQKIGVFGGSFNPPHVGHFILAERIKDILKLDKIIFIPAYIPPHKTKMHIMDPIHRLKMLKLAAGKNSYFEVSDIEIKRGGTSFTYDTLLYLNGRYKNAKLHLIIGMDNYHDFCCWKNYEQIFDLCEVIVLKRRDIGSEKKHMHMAGKVKEYKKKLSSQDRFLFLDTPFLDISSTEIRQRIKAKKTINNYVSEKVAKYIEKNNLYK